MKKILVVGLAMCLAIAHAHATDIDLAIPLKGKKTQSVSDFKSVPTTEMLFRPVTELFTTSSLYCSEGWLGSILHVGDLIIALDARANEAAKKRTKAKVDGKPVNFIASDSAKSPLRQNPEVVARLVGRSEKDCFKVEEKKPTKTFKVINPANSEESVDSAYKICMAVDMAGIASKPCEVSGWNSSVQITIDVRSGEARDICHHLVSAASEKAWRFGRGWKIEIFSPYSNGNTIAYCNL